MQELRDGGWSRTEGAWASRALEVPKLGKDGKLDSNFDIRPVGAYVEVNDRIQKEPPENVRAAELVSELGDSRTWFEADSLSAYRQVLLEEKSQEYTTIWTPIGRLKSRRMPFGLIDSGTALTARFTTMLTELPESYSSKTEKLC